MSTEKHYINEIGTAIIVNCGLDLSSATVYKLEVRKPDGTLAEWQPSILPIDSVYDYLVYYTVAGDFDQAGLYSLQAYLELPAWEGRGETVTFEVLNYYDVDAFI